MEYAPPKRVQTRGCATYGGSGGVEMFGLNCASTSGDNRAEQRIENDYTAGTRQFDGEMRVVSLGGTNVSVKQTFMPNNGAFLMIAVAADGRLYSVGDNGVLATGVVGKWVRVTTIHDVRAGTHEMYADGALKVTKTGARQVAWHDKYGTYRLGSGRGPIVVEWRNVKFFRDGRSPPGGATPPGPVADAGAVDAAADATVLSDAASGTGAGGSGGSGGTMGTGGATGSGGAYAGAGGSGSGGEGGTGGAPATADAGTRGQGGRGGSVGQPAPREGSGGCAFSGTAPAGGSLASLAGLTFLLLSRRRNRGWGPRADRR